MYFDDLSVAASHKRLNPVTQISKSGGSIEGSLELAVCEA